MIDVCLILEGTYPFVAGGVSTWIHQLVTAMSDVRFCIVSISPYPNPRREYKYVIPQNVVDIEDIYLHRISAEAELSPQPRRSLAITAVAEAQERLMRGEYSALGGMLKHFHDEKGQLSFADIIESEEAWNHLKNLYEKHAGEVSFLDFFWTCRSLAVPLVNTFRCRIPPARLYHVVSTGYAGLLAAIAKQTLDSNVLLTEHGVYTHERLLEISQATWIYSPQKERFRIEQELSFFKRVWLGFFDLLGRLTYHHADKITTLYDGNRQKQIAAGAPASKISIIPNGIDVEFWRKVPRKAMGPGRRAVGFVGRVVNIKDVKTFLQAARMVLRKIPEAEFFIIGPTDEEPDYYAECLELQRSLDLEKAVRFTGKANVAEWYAKLDAVVLTSLSEAQPYAILEANAVGVPVVATDVGACREMLEGLTPEDKALGASGLLTGVAHPEETARAVVRLLTDEELWLRLSDAGRLRTMRFYDQKDLISRYSNLYEEMMR